LSFDEAKIDDELDLGIKARSSVIGFESEGGDSNMKSTGGFRDNPDQTTDSKRAILKNVTDVTYWKEDEQIDQA